MASRSNKATKENVTSQLQSGGKPSEASRKEILEALDAWLGDDSGYDEKVWPELKKAIEDNRLSSRKPFRE